MSTSQSFDPSVKLGHHAKTVRRQRGFTQEQLAKIANVSRSFIIELENGHPRAELGKVAAVFKALGLELSASPRTASAAELLAEEKAAAFADILNSDKINIDQATREVIGQYISGEISIDHAYSTITARLSTNLETNEALSTPDHQRT